MSEWKAWRNASHEVKREGLKLFELDKFTFKILEDYHPQAMDLHYVVREIGFNAFMDKLTDER